MPDPSSAADPATGTFLVRHRLAVLALLGLLLYVPWLGSWDVWYPDEPDIGEVAIAMYTSGDWVAPRRMGTIWVDYPPALYWFGVSSAHLFGGVTAFALRLPNALTAIGIVLMTAAVGSRWYGPRAGLWAGLALLTFQQWALQAVGYRPDVLFTLGIAGGLFVYSAGAGERPRWWLRVAGFALLGFAMLAKGPLGLLLPGLVLTLWHATRRQWRRLLELAPLALISLAVYLPWFVACAHAMGADNIAYELYAQNFARFAGGARGHAQPVYYYLANIWTDLFPWGVLLPFAVWWTWRTTRFRRVEDQLLAWWFGAFFVFLSIAVTKRQLYLLPAYPAAALLLGPWLASFGRSEDAPSPRPVRIYGWVVAAVFTAMGLAALVAAGPAFDAVVAHAHLNPPEMAAATGLRVPLTVVGLVWLGAAATLARAAWRSDPRSVVRRLAGAHVVLYACVFAFVFPAMNPTKTYRQAGEWMLNHMGDASHFGLVYPGDDMAYRKMGGFGYFTGRLVVRMETIAQIETFFAEYPGSVVMVHASAVDALLSGPGEPWRDRIVDDAVYAGGQRYVALQDGG